MPFVEWTEKYSIGIGEIDAQHQELFAFINEVYRLIEEKGEKNVLPKEAEKLADFMTAHFATEERYMEQCGFAGFRTHQIAHEGFDKKIHRLQEKAERQGHFDLESLELLKSWLQGHILGADRQYAACLHEHGLK